MHQHKVAAHVIGWTCLVALIAGVVLLIAPKPVTVTTAIVIICLSIASGILIPNPHSVVALIIGICMLVIPVNIAGIVMTVLGLGGAVVNLIISKAKWALW